MIPASVSDSERKASMQKTWVRILTTLTTLGLMVMIFCFSTQPAEQSDATSGFLAVRIADRLRPEWRSLPEKERKEFYDGIQHTVRKCAHFTEFALLGISLRLCLESWRGSGKNNGLPSWGGGTGYAALDELHQLMVDGRSGQWTDILLDSAGVFCGVLLTALILRRLVRGQAARTK